MVVIEDDHMIQALATNASDHPLDVAFCHGLRGAMQISSVRIPCTLDLKDSP